MGIGLLTGTEVSRRTLAVGEAGGATAYGPLPSAQPRMPVIEIETSLAPWRAVVTQWQSTIALVSEHWDECVASEPVNQLRREECATRSERLSQLVPLVLAPPVGALLLVLLIGARARRFWGGVSERIEGREFEGSWRIEAVRRCWPWHRAGRDASAWLLGLRPCWVTIGRRPAGVMYVSASQRAPRVGETWSLFVAEPDGPRRYMGVRRDPEVELEQVRRPKAKRR